MAKRSTNGGMKAAPRPGSASTAPVVVQAPSAPPTANPAQASTGTATATASAPRSVTPSSASPTHEQVAKRAYEIWVAKGRPQGKDVENWRQAERELMGR
jgi:hypothetical protein